MTASSQSAKSNRAQADVNEGELTKLLAKHFAVPFTDDQRLADAEARVWAAHEAEEAQRRLDLSRTNAARMSIVAADLVTSRVASLGPVKSVRWMGQNSTLVDTHVQHERGETNFTAKSTRRGNGTAKNLGMAAIVDLFGLPAGYASFSNLMYDRVMDAWVAALAPDRSEQLSKMSIAGRKSAATEHERALAKGIAHEMLLVLAQRVVRSWESLTPERRRHVARVVSGGEASMDPDLFHVRDHGSGATVAPVGHIANNATVTLAHDPGKLSIVLACDGIPTTRISLNCTNRLGLSATCARCFEL